MASTANTIPSYQLPEILALPSLPTADRAAILDHLFEPCIPLHTLSVSLLTERPFPSYDDLIAGIGAQLTVLAESTSTNDTKWLQDILGAHPRLGEKKVDSTQSRSEQAQLLSDVEHGQDRLAELNALYEQTFPGLRYVVFVNGRDRTTILEDMQARIDRRNIGLERADAIKAICEIAAERARKLRK